MQVLLITIEIILLLISLILLKITYKSLKKIWQKITIVYNHIYEKLITYFYTTDIRRDLMKSEIKDFYESILAVNCVDSQKRAFKDVEWFVSKLLEKNVETEIEHLNILYDYYSSIYRLICILESTSLLLIISIIILAFIK